MEKVYSFFPLNDEELEQIKRNHTQPTTHLHEPNSLKSIGDSAFSECTALKHITIPDSVSHIGKDVFRNCKRLRSVSVPKKLTISRNQFPFFCLVSRR